MNVRPKKQWIPQTKQNPSSKPKDQPLPSHYRQPKTKDQTLRAGNLKSPTMKIALDFHSNENATSGPTTEVVDPAKYKRTRGQPSSNHKQGESRSLCFCNFSPRKRHQSPLLLTIVSQEMKSRTLDQLRLT